MEKFDLYILGCGSASPTPRHNPSAQVIDFRDNLMMIDCGEGTQKMMRQMHLKFSRLKHIFISHLHGDHCLGLPGLLSTLALHQTTGTINVYLPAEGAERVIDMINFVISEHGPMKINYVKLEGNPGVIYETPSLTVEAFPLYHRVPCFGFLFREKPRLRHLRSDMIRFYNIPVSQLHGIKGGADYVTPEGVVVANERLTTPADPARSYAYCSDTMFDARVAEAVKGVDVLYHEATYHSSMAETATLRGHSTAAQAAQIAAMAGVKTLVIGHYSKRYTDIEMLTSDAQVHFPNVIGADEGMKIEISNSL